MPTTSADGTFTVPEPTDPPDVPYWLKSLADQVEDTYKPVHIATPPADTTDASGYVTFTHGAPFTPSAILAQVTSPTAGSAVISVDAITSTTCRVRFAAWNSTGSHNSSYSGGIVLVCFR